jgi:hypothetical protein
MNAALHQHGLRRANWGPILAHADGVLVGSFKVTNCYDLGFQRLIKGTAPSALQQLAATNTNDCEAKIAAPCTGY